MDLLDGRTRQGKKDVRLNLRFSSASYLNDLKQDKPQIVFKVASNINNSTPRSVNETLDYIARNNKNFDEDDYIAPEDQDGNKLNKDDLMGIKSEWRSEFSEESTKSRVMTHFILSINETDDKSVKKFEAATREFLKDRFGEDGFRYCFTIHTDTDKPHAHIIINNNNLERNRKFRMDNQWLYETRIKAAEHLKEYGLNYSATLKRDRVFAKEKERSNEKDYVSVNNWYEAQLKKSSTNREHYKKIKTQKEFLDLAKRRMDATGNDDDKIEFRKQLLAAKMLMKDNPKQSRDKIISALKSSKITRKDVQEFREKQDEKAAHHAEKLNQQIERAASDLVRAERSLKHLKPQDRPVDEVKLRERINEQKVYFEKNHNIDFEKIESMMEKSEKKDRLSPGRELEKLAQKAARSVARGNVEEKTVYRFFDELQTAKNKAAKQNQPIQQKHIDDVTSRALKEFAKSGIDVLSVRDKWSREAALKDDLSKLRVDIQQDKEHGNLTDHKKVTGYQTRIDEIKQRAERMSLSEKERVRIEKSLEARQKILNATRATPRHMAESELLAVEPQLKKLMPDQKRRHTAIRERMLDAKEKIDQLGDDEKTLLLKRYEKIRDALAEKGIDLDKAEAARKRAKEIKKTVERGTNYLKAMRNSAMKADINQLQKAYDDANKAQADAKRDPSLNRQQRQEINQKARLAEQTLSAEIANRTNTFWSNVNKAETLYAEATQIKKRDPKSISNVERVTGKRRLEQISKEYGKIAPDIKADISLAGSNDMRQSLMHKVQQMDKTMSRGQERGFER